MAKREGQQIIGQIANEELRLKEIEERIELFSEKARELRNLAYTLQAEQPNPETPSKVADLQRQALYYDSLAEKATNTERHNQLYDLNILKENALRLRHTISYNELILAGSHKEVEHARERAAKMIEEAERKVSNVEYLIREQKKELLVLEGLKEFDQRT